MRRLTTLVALLCVFTATVVCAQDASPRLRSSAVPAMPPPGGGDGGTPATIVASEKFAAGSTSNATTYDLTALGTFSLATDAVGVCVVINTDDAGGDDGADEPDSLTQTGQTWTKHTTATMSSTRLRATLFYTIGANAAAAGLTVTYPSGDNQIGVLVVCEQFTNAATSAPILRVASASGENAGSLLNAGSSTILEATLAGRSSGSAVFGVLGARNACTWTAESGFTAGTEVAIASPTTEVRGTVVVGGTDSSASLTASACDANRIDYWIGLAVEIAANTSGADTLAPVAAIQLPTVATDYEVATAAGFAFSGIAQDNNAVTSVTYTCDNCAVKPAVVGTSTWAVTGVTLGCSAAPGTLNTIVVTAHDAAANTGTDTIRVRCITPDTIVPTVAVLQPSTTPITVSLAAYTLSGTAADETALHATEAVNWTCDNCAVTSGVASGASSWSAALTLGCSSGAGTSNSISVTSKDTSNNVSAAAARVITCISSDTTAPVVTITSNCGGGAGANCTVASMPQVVSGTLTDNVAVDRVSGASLSCNPTIWTASGVANWSSPQLFCPEGAHTVTVTGYDAAGNSHTDSVQITYVTPLTITTSALAGGEVGTSYSSPLVVTGGVSPYVWDNNSGGTSLGAGACTGLSISSVGVVSGTPTTEGTCSFTAKVTDSAAATDTQALTLVVVASGSVEDPHDYFDTLKALPTAMSISSCLSTIPGDNGSCSFRSQAQLDALVASSPSTRITYGYSTDDYAQKQDAAKLVVAANAQHIPSNQQLYVPLGGLNTGDVTLVWDAWYGPEFQRTECGGQNTVKTYKTWQLRAGTGGNGSIYFEVRNNWLDESLGAAMQDCTDVSATDTRIYPAESGAGWPVGLVSDTPVRPTGLGALVAGAHVVKVSTWTRYIMHVKMHLAASSPHFDAWENATGTTMVASPAPDGSWNALYLWACDELRSCVPIMFGVPWKVENTGNGNDRDLRSFNVEFNTSTATRSGGAMTAYFRNLVVLRNYSLALDMSDTVIFKKPIGQTQGGATADCSASASKCSIAVSGAQAVTPYTISLHASLASTSVRVASDSNCDVGADVDYGIPKYYTANSSAQILVPIAATAACTVIVGETIVNVAGGANIQTAINNATAGDSLVLAAGATFTGGSFILKSGLSGWVTIRGAGAGATITTTNENSGAIVTENNTQYWELKNLTVTSSMTSGTLIALGSSSQTSGQMPKYVVIDDVNFTGDVTNGNKRGLLLNGGYTVVKNSTFTNIKHLSEDACGICGWNGTGPYVITDNSIQAAAYNIMFGGSDPSITNLVPTNITITGNTLTKDPAWQSGNWRVKNIFELKAGIDVLFRGNTLQYNWGGKGDASGAAIWLKSVNQDGGCTWCEVRNVTIENNVISHVGAGLILHETPLNNGFLGVPASNITVHNNSWAIDSVTYNGGQYFALLQGVADTTFSYNTITMVAHGEYQKVWYLSDKVSENLSITRNIFQSMNTTREYTVVADGNGVGTSALNHWATGWTFANNIMVTPFSTSGYPQGQGNVYGTAMPSNTTGYGYGQVP